MAIREQLVDTWTGDGVRLHGVLTEWLEVDPSGVSRPFPAAAADAVTGDVAAGIAVNAGNTSGTGTGDVAGTGDAVDAVLLISGVGSNFYSSSLMARLAEAISRAGVVVLRVNTRGHDMISTVQTRAGGRLAGAAFETVDDCRLDVTAWIDLLAARGCRRVGLVGHSLGAIKVLYSQSLEPHDAVTRVVAISPPRLAHDAFLIDPRSHEFRRSLRTATELAESGQSGQLFEATFPFRLVMSAATYLDKYGPESRYDLTKFANRVTVPVCFTFGEVELQSGGTAFAGLDERVRRLDWPQPPVVHTVAGADHFYTGADGRLCEVVQTFLRLPLP